MNMLRVQQCLLWLPKWPCAALAVLALIVSGIVGFWWPAEAGETSGGAPHLMVDRTEIDLGDLPFDQRATAVFTLTNAGYGVLKILEEPPVEVVKGC